MVERWGERFILEPGNLIGIPKGARSERDRYHLLRGKEVGDKPCLIEGFCEDSMFQNESKRHKACILQIF